MVFPGSATLAVACITLILTNSHVSSIYILQFDSTWKIDFPKVIFELTYNLAIPTKCCL